MISICGLHDLKVVGNRFSWTEKRYKHDVSCCVDRATANSELLVQFPSAQFEFLPFEGSDHRPLVVSISKSVEQRWGNFRYDCRLFQHESFRDSVVACWNNNEDHRDLSSRIRKCEDYFRLEESKQNKCC